MRRMPLARMNTRKSVTEREIFSVMFGVATGRSPLTAVSARISACPHPNGVRDSTGRRWLTSAVDLDLVFLGTSGSMPTAQRAPAALLLRRGGERMLFDCAEGTQRQLLRSNVGLLELREVFLTHYHADHYLGLPGMLKTFALRGREVPITIYGPPGLSDLFGDLRRVFGRLAYPYELVTLRPGDVLARDEYRIEAFAPNHGRNAVGYALVEEPRPGRFDPDAAEGLGIPIGPERGALQRGEVVTLPDGRVITPDSVV